MSASKIRVLRRNRICNLVLTFSGRFLGDTQLSPGTAAVPRRRQSITIQLDSSRKAIEPTAMPANAADSR